MTARCACLVLTVVLAACISDSDRVTREIVDARSCPDDRVHVTELPQLALIGALPSPEWHEPLLPDDVAGDPDRLALWQQRRDDAYLAWQRAQHPGGPQELAVYEATGCGAPRLFVCERAGRHRRACNALHSLYYGDELVACRDQTAPRLVDGVFGCAAEPAVDVDVCRDRCEGEAACRRRCVASAVDQCRRDGLGPLGLCRFDSIGKSR